MTTDKGGIIPVSSATHLSGQHLEVCYSNQIPVNTSILLWDESWSAYELQAVQIPSYRNDRICIAVPYQNFTVNGVPTVSAEYVVFID